MTVLELLVAAREKIADHHNWGKRHYYHDGRCCAIGALMLAHPERQDSNEEILTYGAACAALRGAIPPDFIAAYPDYNPVSCFNDHRTTTHQDVLALYDRAIARCKKEELAA